MQSVASTQSLDSCFELLERICKYYPPTSSPAPGLWSAGRQLGFMLLIVLKATRSADRSNRNLFLCKDKLTSCKQTETGAAERHCDAASERGLSPAQRHHLEQTQRGVITLWSSWTQKCPCLFQNLQIQSKTFCVTF